VAADDNKSIPETGTFLIPFLESIDPIIWQLNLRFKALFNVSEDLNYLTIKKFSPNLQMAF